MSAMERTELKMAVIAEQLGLSWAGKSTQMLCALLFVFENQLCSPRLIIMSPSVLIPQTQNCLRG